MQERWQIKNPTIQSLDSPAVRILKQRGLTPEEIESFLRPVPENLSDPLKFPGIPSALTRISQAREEQERVLIYGDYDVDGITSTALLLDYLTEIWAVECLYYIPDRIRDGYGLNLAAFKSLGLENFELVITVDCGITALEEIKFLQERGIDVIVTDHHEPADEQPPALSLINHHLLEGDLEIKGGLSGVGTAFKLCQALEQQRLSRQNSQDNPPDKKTISEKNPGNNSDPAPGGFKTESHSSGSNFENLETRIASPDSDSGPLTPYLKSRLDLVALGTVADLVPLQGENRILVREGLKVLKNTDNPGLQALAGSLSLDLSREISAGQIGYILAPPINAAGRIKSADQALQLLLAGDRRQVEGLAQNLVEYNYQRRQEEDQTLEEALEMIEASPPCEEEGIVLASRSWHPGVIGIVASRLVEKYYRPVILIALEGKKQAEKTRGPVQAGDNNRSETEKNSSNPAETDRGRGSGRSISALNLHRALKACSSHLLGFGGHRQAAGLEIEAGKVANFRRAFNNYLKENLSSRDFIPARQIDDILSEKQISLDFYQELKTLKPHGIGNPAPTFLLPQVSLQQARAVGRDNSHLQLTTSGGLKGIGFNLAQDFDFPGTDSSYNLIARVEDNNWQGRHTVQLNLKNLVPVSRQQDYPIIYSGGNLKLHDFRNCGDPCRVIASIPGDLNSCLIYLNNRKLKAELEEKFPRTLCCTSADKAAASNRRQVVFFELPFSLAEMIQVIGFESSQTEDNSDRGSIEKLELYFLFGKEDLSANQRILQHRLISKEALEQAWKLISRQERFTRKELPGLLKDCPGLKPAAVDQLLEIWQELELVTREEKEEKDYRITGSFPVKLDFSHSIRYNRNVEIKEDFARLKELVFSSDLRELFALLQQGLKL